MNVIKTKSKSKFRISRYCSSYTVFFIQSVLPAVLSSCDEKVIATNANIRKKVSEYNAMENGDTLFNCLDTSKVSDMTDLFINQNTFNADISSWDISYVTTMHVSTTIFRPSFQTILHVIFTNVVHVSQPLIAIPYRCI